MDFNKKDSMLTALAVIISVGSYAAARLAGITNALNGTDAIFVAMAMTLLLGLVCFLIYKINSPSLGILSSLVGYKMIPPNIPSLSQADRSVELLYFLVGKAAVLIFIMLMIKHYTNQKKPYSVKILPIVFAMLAVPFFAEIAEGTYSFFIEKTGSMLGYYFAQFGCYTLATLLILAVACKAGHGSLEVVGLFEYIALAVNILRRGALIIYYQLMNYHISKSYYCWIVIYALLAIVTFVLMKKAQKSVKNEQA